jgi:heptosyltransferase-2
MEWLRMGIFDDLKKNNQRTYQEIMCSILDIPVDGMKYILELKDGEKEKGREHLAHLQLDFNKNIIGIHTGGGDRWALKQWHEERFIDLIRELSEWKGREVQILLFGGPSERERNLRIRERLNIPVFDAGCDNNVRHFASLISYCTVVVTGDSLAMHIALAMNRRVVVLFGPTSNKEIELFGNGEKIIPDMECLVCYKPVCDFVPNCMDLISVDAVKKSIIRQLTMSRNK